MHLAAIIFSGGLHPGSCVVMKRIFSIDAGLKAQVALPSWIRRTGRSKTSQYLTRPRNSAAAGPSATLKGNCRPSYRHIVSCMLDLRTSFFIRTVGNFAVVYSKKTDLTAYILNFF